MKIAILGYGTIGSGVYEIISNYKNSYINPLEVVKVLDLPQNKHKLPIITSDIEEILQDERITCVIEVMGGLHPAYEFISRALQAKKHVITANKAVVAAYMEEFLTLAKENNVRILFEASVGGGIPWIASLVKAKRVDTISKFYGIFNGTSNYILDAMYTQSKDFTEVLEKAQALGYAESDPSADIDGYDVQNKTVISSAIAFNSKIDAQAFPVYGIRHILKNDIEYLKNKNLNVKYIGEATANDTSYEAFVMPNIFATDVVEANVGSNFNMITLHGESIGPLKFYGQGAGKLPTANAMVQDVIDLYNPATDYAIDLSHPLHYEAKQQNVYLIRSSETIQHEAIASVEVYNNYVYHTTHAIQADVLQTLVDAKDATKFVAKYANLEG